MSRAPGATLLTRVQSPVPVVPYLFGAERITFGAFEVLAVRRPDSLPATAFEAAGPFCTVKADTLPPQIRRKSSRSVCLKGGAVPSSDIKPFVITSA